MELEENVFIVKIVPRPTPRPRLGKNGAYNESWYTKYKNDIVVQLNTSKFKKQCSDYGTLFIRFGMPYPKIVKGGIKAKIESRPHQTNSGDLDNLTKGVKDALQKAGILVNDCQIYCEFVSKVWTNSKGYITIKLE